MEKISNKLISTDYSLSSHFYEKAFWAKQAYVCGVDEVGRGCLAGPVVTAAVILYPSCTHPLLKDSKILTENKRNEAATWILKNSWYSYGSIDATDIDRLNIYKATQEAMKQAVYGLLSQKIGPWKPELILIDAMPLAFPHLSQAVEVLSFPFGESRSISIAAASILAKVKRDELITRMSRFFPGYHFEDHKSYGTNAHYKALQNKGKSLIHRVTFLKEKSKKAPHENTTDNQTSLFCGSN